MEVEVLFEYKHENIIGLVGYCDENGEKILVYEYASNGSLDRHLTDASLTWTKRLKIGIDIATGLDFLHGAGYPVIHKNIKSSSILLNDDWKAKITGFGLSVYMERGFSTGELDVYKLGVVLFEMMCGKLVKDEILDELVFEGIKDTVVTKSLTTFQTIVYECINGKRGKRPTASEVVLQLKKALEFQVSNFHFHT
ncbi:putative protein kinase RLK-Pelle-CR4L family [Helianthus annuus]|nr:putative protein kinase RLK-Pelle-CR4L family [Helianthus annuus]